MTMSEETPKSLEGWEPRIETEAELHRALNEAFDYRGDVTLMLKDGEKVQGFVFNRDLQVAEPFISLYPPSEDSPARKLKVADIDGLIFSGKDTATGNSWEAWVSRWEAKHGPRS